MGMARVPGILRREEEGGHHGLAWRKQTNKQKNHEHGTGERAPMMVWKGPDKE